MLTPTAFKGRPRLIAAAWSVTLALGAGLNAPCADSAPATRATTAPAAATPAAPSAPLSPAEIASASHTIDQMLEADQAKNSLKPNPRTSDEVFLRRAYLELAGRIPTFDETTTFISSRKPSKRQDLLHALVGSAGWDSSQYDFWADLLRVETRLNDRYPGQAYIDWLKQSLHDNKPYDQLVRDLLTAEGPAIEKGNGAAGYYVRDAGMPLDNMSNTIQVFLGTQLTCAQCHNHPNDKWTRKDYYEMAAFTAGTAVSRNMSAAAAGGKGGGKGQGMAAYKQIAQSTPEVKNAFRMLSYTIGLRVQPPNGSTITLPADYQYKDAKPGEPVEAHTMFGDMPPVGPKQDSRALYAKWLTSPENPRFTEVIANRMWKRVMGLGLIEPVDHLTDSTQASNPELMRFLTRLMIGLKFDLRRYQEILYQTEAWGRQSNKQDYNPAETFYFPGPLLHRMTANQVWDSLLTLVVADLDEQKGANADGLYAFYEANKDKTQADIVQMAVGMGDTRAKLKELQQEMLATRTALETATGDQVPKLRAKMQELMETRAKLSDEADPLKAMIGMGKAAGAGKGKAKPMVGNGVGPLLRASELSSPAPAGHLLRTFGQSDRQLIDNGSDNPAVTQALSLLNGFIDAEVVSERSLLTSTIAKVSDPADKVRALFLMILSRQPSDKELALVMKNAAADGKDALADIAWSLLNTNEFLFVR
jgi:Protein of unknown function (DUF1549)/Protein of unknown function (DUF1553)